MTALAQGSAGMALVMCFALLSTSQVGAAVILLAIQSCAVAVTAAVLQQPLMALPPLILAAGFWLLHREMPMFHAHTAPTGGAKLGIGIAAVLAILCQSQGSLTLPSAVILLSILLATTRSHPLMQVVALVAAQNGLALAHALMTQPTLHAVSLPASLLLPIACLALPLPLVAGLLAPAITSWPYRATSTKPLAQADPNSSRASATALRLATWCRARLAAAATALGWFDLGLAFAMFAATLIVPLDSLASVFAPLLGLDGVMRSYARRNRFALTPTRRGSALLQSGFTILVVCDPNLIVAWLALLAAIAMAVLPTMSRRWNGAVLALLAAALCLFGFLLLPAAPSVLAYFSLFAGFVTIAAVVPDLAVVLAILLMRLSNQAPWPSGIETLGIGIATVALLTCAILLTSSNRSHRIPLLVLSQASIAALTICIGHPEERFAALVLLVLLILSRTAARITAGPVATLAIAGLGGLPPLGVFPGLVLIILALSAHDPWLLLPVGVALIPMAWASCPRQLPDFLPAIKTPSIAWLPLLLAVLAGYFAPNSLVHWWRILTGGRT